MQFNPTGAVGTAVLRNNGMRLDIDIADGSWTYLGFDDGASGPVVAGHGYMFEVFVEDKPLLGSLRQVSDCHRYENGERVALTYESAGLSIIQHIELSAGRVRQWVDIHCTGGSERLLTEVRYTIPGFTVGQPADCLLQCPGQLLPPDSDYLEAAAKPLDRIYSEPHPDYPQGWLESAPDQTSGLIAVENRAQGRIASAWLYSELAPAFPMLDGTGSLLTVSHGHKLTAWLRPGVQVRSSFHHILLTEGSLERHLAIFRAAAYDGAGLAGAAGRPEWLKDARLLQIDARPVAVWREKISGYRKLGFNTLYLLPVWANFGNPYSMIDHYTIDNDTSRSGEWAMYPDGICPEWNGNPFPVGSAEELKDFVTHAHDMGFRVLFDLIPQGIGASTDFARRHRDWLVKDALDRPAASHGWGPSAGEPVVYGSRTGTYSMDWGNPAYRAFIVKWALWNVMTFNIDGFRTDAMHWKEANLSRSLDRPAWETTFGGVRLIEELRSALKAVKPDAVLLGEVWGPIFQRAHDATYENGWLLNRLNLGWLTGLPAMTGAQWARHLDLARSARPAGLIRANFGANHDFEQFVRLAKHHPLGNAVQFVHIFSDGIPFVWYKEIEGRDNVFSEMLKERALLQGYSCCYRAAEPSSKHLFTALWQRGVDATLAVANLSGETVVSSIGIDHGGMDWSGVRIRYAFNRVEATAEGKGISVKLAPGGCALLSRV